MKQFGDVVVLQRDKHTVNALVAQSVKQADGEHLTVFYLDPTKASPLLSGSAADNAIRRDFVTPLVDGKVYGWRDPELSEDAQSAVAQLAQSQDDAEALRKEVEARIPASEHAALKAEFDQLKDLNKSLTDSNGQLAAKVNDLEAARSKDSAAIADLEKQISKLQDELLAAEVPAEPSVADPTPSTDPQSITSDQAPTSGSTTESQPSN